MSSGKIDPDGAFGPQVRVERHLRSFGHLPDEDCADTGDRCDKCKRPDTQIIRQQTFAMSRPAFKELQRPVLQIVGSSKAARRHKKQERQRRKAGRR